MDRHINNLVDNFVENVFDYIQRSARVLLNCIEVANVETSENHFCFNGKTSLICSVIKLNSQAPTAKKNISRTMTNSTQIYVNNFVEEFMGKLPKWN